MRTIKITLLGLFILAIFPAFSGTTYYVRSDSGSDTNGNDGKSENTAFLTLTKVFSGTPALIDGDIINISGTFDYYAQYKIINNITIQGTDKSTSIIRGLAGASKNCFFIGSSSPVATPTVVIENVTFQDFDYWSNTVSNNGGVITVIGASSLTCRKVVFNNNQAYGGGAVYITAGTGVFEDCYFLNNRAKQRTGAANAHGGAIAVSTAAAVNISLTIDRCLFEGNTAENTGPAMRFVTAGTGTATLLVQNSTFTGNIVKLPSAATTSGALTLSLSATGTSDVKFINNTIAYNTSEIATSTANGLFIGGVTDKIVAINNIIYSNTRPDNSDY
jgi:predicted outer membrane repeat protein